MIDTHEILAKVSLADLIEADLGQPVKHSGKWLFWHCPFHPGDNNPSLGVTSENGRYFCFACGKTGDAIGWAIEYRKLPFLEACQSLGAGDGREPARHAPPPLMKDARPLPDELQSAWLEIIETCSKNLWSDMGQKARDYLHGRGLKDETLQSPFFRVGYSPGAWIAGVWVERGIVLPCFITNNDLSINRVWYVKIRRPINRSVSKEIPYVKLRGKLRSGEDADCKGLYGAVNLKGAEFIFLTEGEFDALLLHQEAGDLAGVATLGGATDRFDFGRFGSYLAWANRIYVAYDTDRAGQIGADYWRSLSGRVTVVNVPNGKDVTDFWKAGGDLSRWIYEILQAEVIDAVCSTIPVPSPGKNRDEKSAR